MGLRTKLITVLVGVLSLFGIFSITFFTQVISPNFLVIEEKDAINDLYRVVYAIHNEIDYLNSLNHDWSSWDATYEFIQSRSNEYVEENLPASVFSINQLNLIHYYDLDGTLVWGKSHNLETGEFIDIKEFSHDRLPSEHHIINFEQNKTPLSDISIKGIWMTEQGPMMISSRPILDNNSEGPIKGALLMGRFLNNSIVEKITQLTKVDFELFRHTISNSPPHIQGILQQLNQKQPFFIDRINDYRLEIFSKIPDINGKSGLVVRGFKDREIFNRSQEVMSYAIVSLTLSIITIFVLLSYFMQKIVVGPISSLKQHVLEIGRTGNLATRFEVKSNDEIGHLAEEFNVMIDKLHVAKHKLQEQSFQQGMAELASGILHNVRNSLHKMFSNCEKIRKTIDEIPVEKLTMARQELGDPSNCEARRADLAHFLDATNDTLLLFISQAKDQLNRNHPLVEEIEKTLKSYEKWAFGEKLTEKVLVSPLVQEAYQLLNKEYRESVSLKIGAKVAKIGYVDSNRTILIQVIINLFTNAVESINRKGVAGEISVEAEIIETDPNHVQILFCDNGAGINKNDLDNIFKRGFSTKKGDNTGLGLHWCLNAIESMDGKIFAENIGEGQGACLHLILPLSKEMTNNS